MVVVVFVVVISIIIPGCCYFYCYSWLFYLLILLLLYFQLLLMLFSLLFLVVVVFVVSFIIFTFYPKSCSCATNNVNNFYFPTLCVGERIVTICGIGCPCGGTHVKNVALIQHLKVTRIKKVSPAVHHSSSFSADVSLFSLRARILCVCPTMLMDETDYYLIVHM